MTKKRTTGLLFVGNFLSQEVGSFAASEELATRLVRSGWQVLTVSHHPSPILRLADMLATAVSKRRMYRLAHVDVFSGRGFLWAELVALAFRRLGKPYVLTLHGGGLPNFARRCPARVQRLMESAACVTTPSGYLHQTMRKFRKDLVVLPNSLEISLYPFKVRINPQPSLVWMRAFHEIYNPPLAVQVLSLLKEQIPNVCLTMVGPDKQDGSLEKTRKVAREMGVWDRIKIQKAVPKRAVPTLLDGADIFLNTTNVDNTPVSVIEAMACGLCVVTTKVGGIPYLLQHDHDALMVPPDHAPAMTEAVMRVLFDRPLAEKLSENARRKAEGFDWSITLPKWESILMQAAGTQS